MPLYAGKYAICAFLQNMRNMLRSHDCYKPVSLSCTSIFHTLQQSTCGYLLAINYNHTSILHGYRDIKPQRFLGHDLDLLGSRDIISPMTIRLAICSFLYVLNHNHMSILHGYGNMKPQIFWGHDLDLLGSRDVIG